MTIRLIAASAALTLSLPLLTGCVAAALVPFVPLASGTMEAGVVVTVDPATLSQSTKSTLQRAKTLGVISIDRASIKAADFFETRGGYLVKIDRVAAKQGEMTGSERREALAALCAAKGVDVALLGHVTKTETNNTAVAALTGRAKSNLSWTMDVLPCSTRTPDSFGGTVVIDVGIYNGNPAKIEEAMGDEMGSKILEAIGRLGAPQAGSAVPATEPNASAESTLPVRKDETPKEAVQMPKGLPVTMSPMDIQRKLIDLGYLTGKADGVIGKNSIEALKKFQQESGLPVTGKPDNETLARLKAKGQ